MASMYWLMGGTRGELTMSIPDAQKTNRVVVTSVLRDRTPAKPADPLDEAEVIWGEAGNFSWGNTSADFAIDPLIRPPAGGGVTWPENPEEPPTPLPVVETWEEVARDERTVRIDGPNGAYVDFARVDEVLFRLPDLPGGVQHFVLQKFKKFGDETTAAPETTA